MADELALQYVSGETITAIVWGKDRSTRWNGSAMVAPSTIADAAWHTGAISLTELDTSDSTGTGQYVGDLPATGEDGEHQIDFYATASPTPGMSRIGYQVAGVAEVDMTKLGGDSDSFTKFKCSIDSMETGVVVADAGNTDTIFLTDLEQETANYYGDSDGGLVIVFVDGTTNQYQSRRIIASKDSGASTHVTLEAALDAAPSADDEFVVLGRITELS